MTLDDLINNEGFTLKPIFNSIRDTITGFELEFGQAYREDGATGTEAGKILTINWIDGDHVLIISQPQFTVTNEGEKYVVAGVADFDLATNLVTDLSLVRNYFGEGFADSLQVLPVADLGYDIV